MLASGDVDSIDPGVTYGGLGYMVSFALHRSLVGYKPDDPVRQVPDVAAELPKVSADGKTVTVKLRTGVRFSPPVDREVTSADVKYAIERGFFKTVNNPYAGTYFGDLAGAKLGAAPGTEIRGIETPNATTIVFRLTRGTGGVLASALATPLSAPVPAEYAAVHDRKTPSTYGRNQVATGPYMIENDSSGRSVGYRPGQEIRLVRNPNWNRASDHRPAYLDEILVRSGNDNTALASRRVLRGRSMITGDISPPPAVLRSALTRDKDQIELASAGSTSYITLNTALQPFDDINVRRAVIAGVDREAFRAAGGGAVIGEIATHIIPPGMPGFEEAGGLRGPGLDFVSNPKGDPEVAAAYFEKAGFSSGRYEGGEEIFMVGVTDSPHREQAEVARHELEELGFKVKLRLMHPAAAFTRFCGVPKAKVHACPNLVWTKDFNDPETMIDPTFHGRNIAQEGNRNVSQLDVPELNQAMDRARLLTVPAERAKAWAEVDRMVIEQAPAVPVAWQKQALLRSENVVGVVNESMAIWDLTFTSVR